MVERKYEPTSLPSPLKWLASSPFGNRRSRFECGPAMTPPLASEWSVGFCSSGYEESERVRCNLRRLGGRRANNCDRLSGDESARLDVPRFSLDVFDLLDGEERDDSGRLERSKSASGRFNNRMALD